MRRARVARGTDLPPREGAIQSPAPYPRRRARISSARLSDPSGQYTRAGGALKSWRDRDSSTVPSPALVRGVSGKTTKRLAGWRAGPAKGFRLLPRRWVVQRTLAWLNRNQRRANGPRRRTVRRPPPALSPPGKGEAGRGRPFRRRGHSQGRRTVAPVVSRASSARWASAACESG